MGRAINDHVRGNLVRLRKLRGLDHAGLGKEAGLSKAEIERLEAGAAPVDCDCLFRLAAALEVPIAGFFEGLALPTLPDASEGEELDIDHLEVLEIMAMLKVYNTLGDGQKQMVRNYIRDLSRN